MFKDIAIVDLTKFVEFVYWPIRDAGDGCFEPIFSGDTSEAVQFSVYGKHWDPASKADLEEWVADFSTIAEAATYCLILNRSLKGMSEGLTPHKDVEEKEIEEENESQDEESDVEREQGLEAGE